MPPPIPVELHPHSPAWSATAVAEEQRLKEALGQALIAVHHIGSTSIPGIAAKPILDLMPEVITLVAADKAKERLQALGYQWHGELGIQGRRYCTLAGADGRRRIQLHIFPTGSPQIERHLAFRDYLRAHPGKAREYEAEKWRSRNLHPDDSHAYTAEKSAWIEAVEIVAIAWLRGRQ